MRSITEEIYEIIREIPGSTSAEIVTLMPHVNKQSIYSRVNMAHTQGHIRREKVDGSYRFYMVEGQPVPVVKARKRPKILDAYNHAQNQAKVDSLNAQIAELQAWKADAIARFPVLGVDPAVLRARDIVAKVLRERNDGASAKEVQEGRRDGSAVIAAVLAALEA